MSFVVVVVVIVTQAAYLATFQRLMFSCVRNGLKLLNEVLWLHHLTSKWMLSYNSEGKEQAKGFFRTLHWLLHQVSS